MNYLRAQLEGDAADVISGLSIKLLKERYGQNEVFINAIMLVLWIYLPSQVKHQPCVRSMISLKKHLRSLEALGEHIESKMLVTLIMAKLPKDVVIHLTDQKNDGDEWTV